MEYEDILRLKQHSNEQQWEMESEQRSLLDKIQSKLRLLTSTCTKQSIAKIRHIHNTIKNIK